MIVRAYQGTAYQSCAISGLCWLPCLGKWATIGHVVVYHAWSACAFSAEIVGIPLIKHDRTPDCQNVSCVWMQLNVDLIRKLRGSLICLFISY